MAINSVKIWIIVFGAVVVFFAGYFFGFSREQGILISQLASIHPLRTGNENYKFINPLLLYVIPPADQQKGFADIKNSILDMITIKKNQGKLADAAVVFQELNTGQWIGVNPNDRYSPASMLKVVVMVAYYKKAESDPGILARKLVYTKQTQALVQANEKNQLSQLVLGVNYSIDDLIRRMIIDSDNGATLLLIDNIDRESLNSVYEALSIEGPDQSEGEFTISPRYYSFFFRILYSATYLDSIDSEKALALLAGADFRDGIVAGVPDTISVAHKYGERAVLSGGIDNQGELHDCGIVYYPASPYLLCIMTRGKDLENLKKTIQDISSLVYRNYADLKKDR